MQLAANDPCPPVPPMSVRPRGHWDLLETLLSAANDNAPRTKAETVAALKAITTSVAQ